MSQHFHHLMQANLSNTLENIATKPVKVCTVTSPEWRKGENFNVLVKLGFVVAFSAFTRQIEKSASSPKNILTRWLRFWLSMESMFSN